MPKHINTFHKGLDRDTSKNKVENSTFFDSQNFRLIGNDSTANGALTNIKGTIAKVDLETTEYIRGWCTIKDTIYLITDSINGLRILKFQDTGGDTQIIPDEIFVDPNYIAQFPFTVVGRYESPNIIKLYWSNEYSPIRMINVQDDHTGKSVEDFDINPLIDLGSIFPQLSSGGSYKAGRVQYSYQLYSRNGAETTFSPCSEIVDLYKEHTKPVGNNIDEDVNKSVTVQISNLDEDFDRIRLVAVYYTSLTSIPTINIVTETDYNGTDVTIVDTGEYIGEYTLEEFRLLGQSDYKVKHLETKNNILFGANVNEDTFQSDEIDSWDSRAYRFTSGATTRQSIITDANLGNITIESPTGDPNDVVWTVPENHDCINPSNQLEPSIMYEFQADGTTIGGEGENIKYTFDAIGYSIDDSYTDYKTISVNLGSKTSKIGQSGEVYRVGIAFFNTKGQASKVKWIGDIRFPDGHSSHEFTRVFDGSAIGYNLEVTVKNFPNDPSIQGYQIVYVKRETKDKSIICSGIVAEPRFDSDVYAMPIWATDPVFSYRSFNDLAIPLTNEYMSVFISPEIVFNKEIPDASYLKFEKYLDNFISNDGVPYVKNNHYFLFTKYRDLGYSQLRTDTVSPYYSPINQSSFIESNYNKINYTVDTSIGAKGVYSNINRQPTSCRLKGGSIAVLVTNDLTTTSYHADTASDINYDGKLAYASMVKDVTTSRYGGITYESRSYNEYIAMSDYTAISDDTVICNGDIYIQMFQYLKGVGDRSSFLGNTSAQELVTFPVETSINLYNRSALLQGYLHDVDSFVDVDTSMMPQETVAYGIQLQPQAYNEDIGDLYLYNSVYSREGDAKKYYPKIFDFEDNSESDIKVIASEVKLNNEYRDSWTSFLPNSYIEVAGEYGSINKLVSLNNRLYFIQNKAIGILAVNERSLIRDNTNNTLSLGTGGVLDRYDYISTVNGASDRLHVVPSNKTIYFYDSFNKQVSRIEDNVVDLGKQNAISSYIKSQDPVDVVGYDPQTKEVLFTFDTKSLVYNEDIGIFTGFYSIDAKYFLNLNNKLFSVNTLAAVQYIHKHNEGDYNLFYWSSGDKNKDASYIDIIINPNGNLVNTFDNLDLRLETRGDLAGGDESTITKIDFSNDYSEVTGRTLTLGSNISHTVRQYRLALLNDNSRRMVDTYLKVRLYIEPDDRNLQFLLHDIITFYRQRMMKY